MIRLTDEQMRRFLSRGFLQFEPELSPEIHATIRERMLAWQEKHGTAGNNLLPVAPELQEVLSAPQLQGAITSVAGPGALLHPHRFPHFNRPGTPPGGWHKDSYWGYHRKIRNHRPWWAMIMYYPQAVNAENGPTAVLAGRQHLRGRAAEDMAGEVQVTGPAGTFFMIHYDIWHRASANSSELKRFMIKFEFIRLARPTGPAWDCQDRLWHEPATDGIAYPQRLQWRFAWDWAAANPAGSSLPHDASIAIGPALARLADAEPTTRLAAADELGLAGRHAGEAIPALLQALHDAQEAVAFNAAYALAAIGPATLPGLGAALTHDNGGASLLAAHALSNLGAPAAPLLLDALRHAQTHTRAHAAFALGELESTSLAVTSALVAATRDAEPLVRLQAVEALGHLGPGPANALAALEAALSDSDMEVATNAALALVRWGSAAEPVTPALLRCLRAGNRYLRGYAVEALQRIGTPAALTPLLDYLKASRWCIFSTPEAPFYP